MGRLHATEFAENYDLDTALRLHFTSNCYPPVPLKMIEPAKAAIALVIGDEGDELIDLPEGCSHRRYGKKMPAAAFCNEMRLEAFVENETDVDDPTDDPDEDADA
jgi:hypothetical protein